MDGVILEARGATQRYPGAAEPALAGVSLAVGAGDFVGVVGPNGSGKTTLIRVLTGMLAVEQGEILVAGKPVGAWSRNEVARLVGVVVQREEPAFPLRVRQAVMLGRYPHLPPFGAPRPRDEEVVDRALVLCDVTHLANRWVSTLSGGEWQRVRIARALAQEPRALVLDEATANLDLRHEMEVLELAAELKEREGLGVLLVTHHVNLAVRFVDRLVLMDRGRIRADGPPREVLAREALEEVFHWPVRTVEWNGVPQIVPERHRTQKDKPQ